MNISAAGINLIKEFEGLELTAYPDPATHGEPWTIGYGHTTAAGPPRVLPKMTISRLDAERILRDDLRKYEAAVEKLVTVQLKQNQFDALVSFAYNCGVGNLQKSTLLKRVNQGRFDDVPAEFMKWTKAAGTTMKGLIRRRRAEAALWRNMEDGKPEVFKESRLQPDKPVASKTMLESKEGNAAVLAGGAAAITAGTEVVNNIGTLSEALGRPALLVLVAIALACAAIWYWRKRRLDEEGA